MVVYCILILCLQTYLCRDTRLTTLNTRECYGYSPLMMAVFTGKLDATKNMMEVGILYA